MLVRRSSSQDQTPGLTKTSIKEPKQVQNDLVQHKRRRTERRRDAPNKEMIDRRRPDDQIIDQTVYRRHFGSRFEGKKNVDVAAGLEHAQIRRVVAIHAGQPPIVPLLQSGG
jgi:hypothetical protein